ncbi:MAG: hypothetical protein K2J20_01565, partial [Bacilli bacterium]|nr:hypothetical protein [Bacilli bacterium]
VEGKIEYIFLFSSLGGIFVLLVLISYCDIAIRTVKLALYQLIAPIPILARLVPGEQGGKVFSNWLKATISTYVEVFIRLAILYFAVLVIVQITHSWTDVFTSAFGNGANPIISLLTMAFLIIGIILFVKQAPEIIKEITGLDGGKYNPLKSMKQGLSLLAGGIAGASPIAAVRAWEQAGQAKNFLDFTAIGNQYKRKLAKQEAKAQGAKMTDRMGDSFRKAFGLETKLERDTRRIDRGLDMKGKVQEFKNDTDGDIVLEFLDKKGNKTTRTIKKGETVPLDDKMINALQHKKDINARTLSDFDEKIRHIKEGKDLDQKYIDFRGKIKKKALEKINEGHNHIKQHLVLADGTDLGEMNYAAMKAYEESRVAAGAKADELQMIKEAVMKAEDKMWVEYANWAIEADQGGEIHTWFNQAKQMHDEVGIY